MTQNGSDRIVVHVDADIEDLIPGFLDNRQEDIKSMLGALKQSDFETLRILGHSMKGAGGGYGFDAITEIGQSLELAAKEQNTREIRRIVDELTNYLKQVEVVYD